MDLGTDEIEFFTLFYPKPVGFDWDTEKLLKNELTALRESIYTGVLFLSASTEDLIKKQRNKYYAKTWIFFITFWLICIIQKYNGFYLWFIIGGKKAKGQIFDREFIKEI